MQLQFLVTKSIRWHLKRMWYVIALFLQHEILISNK